MNISWYLTCTLQCSVNFTRNLLAVSPTEIVKQIMNNSQYIRVTYMYTIVLHRFHQKAFTCAHTEILKYIIKIQNDLQVHGIVLYRFHQNCLYAVLHWFHQKLVCCFSHWNSEIDYKQFRMIYMHAVVLHQFYQKCPYAIVSPESFSLVVALK